MTDAAPLLRWRALDVVTGRPLRDSGDLVPAVQAYTAQLARHQVKRMLRTSIPFYVEQIEDTEPVSSTQARFQG